MIYSRARELTLQGYTGVYLGHIRIWQTLAWVGMEQATGGASGAAALVLTFEGRPMAAESRSMTGLTASMGLTGLVSPAAVLEAGARHAAAAGLGAGEAHGVMAPRAALLAALGQSGQDAMMDTPAAARACAFLSMVGEELFAVYPSRAVHWAEMGGEAGAGSAQTSRDGVLAVLGRTGLEADAVLAAVAAYRMAAGLADGEAHGVADERAEHRAEGGLETGAIGVQAPRAGAVARAWSTDRAAGSVCASGSIHRADVGLGESEAHGVTAGRSDLTAALGQDGREAVAVERGDARAGLTGAPALVDSAGAECGGRAKHGASMVSVLGRSAGAQGAGRAGCAAAVFGETGSGAIERARATDAAALAVEIVADDPWAVQDGTALAVYRALSVVQTGDKLEVS